MRIMLLYSRDAAKSVRHENTQVSCDFCEERMFDYLANANILVEES